MGLLSDVVFLSRFQFALTVLFHFCFVPLSIGLGLIMAIAQTKAHRSGDKADRDAAMFWIRIFTATFAVGVATGITMEFAFGTNWADYSRFVGDIFGAPLAAEALLAFFLESSFLGVLLLGRNKVSDKFYTVSAWLVWFGSCLSGLWILIANSWMQTPAGYEIVSTASGTKAVLTNFWAAAFNPSTLPRYFHTIDAVLIMGAFVAIAVAAYHILKGNREFGKKTLKTATIVALVTVVAMGGFGHMQAKEVAEQQPEKLAAMEGQWQTDAMGMSIVGWVDENNHSTISITVPIKGMTSFLASGNFTTRYPGLEDFNADDIPPVNIVFQSYHLMIACFGLLGLWLIFALVAAFKKKKEPPRWLYKCLEFGPIVPFLAIMSGWMVTEVGRQPWIVYHELRTEDAISLAVSAPDLLITICIFIVLYTIIMVVYLKIVLKMMKNGPVAEVAAPKAAAKTVAAKNASDKAEDKSAPAAEAGSKGGDR